jgi:hypothetical protein
MTKAHRRNKESGPKTKSATPSQKSSSSGIAKGIEDPNVKTLASSLMPGSPDLPDFLVIMDRNGTILGASLALCGVRAFETQSRVLLMDTSGLS